MAAGNLSVTGAAKGTSNRASPADRWAFSGSRRHTISDGDWSTDVCTSVRLLDGNNNYLDRDNDSGAGTNSRLIYQNLRRSEERRVGKESRSRWSPYH